MTEDIKADAENVMKRCQIGTKNYNEANNLHAECYGTIGRLLLQVETLSRCLFQMQEAARDLEAKASSASKCTVCSCHFNLDSEGGIEGSFGSLPVAFCPTCYASVCDMVDQVRIKDLESQEPVALKKGECWPEEVMRQWDYWRKEIANGHKGSAPRDWFEGLSELKLIDTPPQRTEQEQPLPPVEIGVDVTADGASVVAFYRRPNAVMEMFYSQFHPAPQRPRIVFPTMLRKMWSGGEVQDWLDENVNKEKNT